MPAYREVAADDERRIRILREAFDPGRGPFDAGAGLSDRHERSWFTGEHYGLVADGDLLTTCTHYPFTARVRGRRLSMAGLGNVATPPEHRREGLVGDLIEASLADYRDRGWELAALWPFDEGFYAQYGWATGARYQVGTVDPGTLSPTADHAAGEFRRVAPEEYDRLEPVYEAWREGFDCTIDRTPEWWRKRVFHTWRGRLYGYVWRRDGEPRGYLLYRITSDRTMRVREFVALDGTAYLNLLRFCYDHDSQVDEVELYGHDHGRLLDVAEGRSPDCSTSLGPMVRIVDVPAALEAVPYPGVEEATVALAVEDDHADWNDGTVSLRVRDGAATVERTDADPDATLDVGTLSQLLVGYRPVARARETGDLECADDATAETLADLFPQGTPYLPDRF